MRSRNDRDAAEIDFAAFHDLSHHVWDPVCPHLSGGRIRHLQHWLQYRVWDDWFRTVLPSILLRTVCCRRGLHRWDGRWHRHPGESLWEMIHRPPDTWECRWCGALMLSPKKLAGDSHTPTP